MFLTVNKVNNIQREIRINIISDCVKYLKFSYENNIIYVERIAFYDSNFLNKQLRIV